MVLPHNHALFHTYLFCLSVVGGRDLNREHKHMHALFVSDLELSYSCITTESITSVLLLGGFVLFFFHADIVKMHKHHGHGTVTH